MKHLSGNEIRKLWLDFFQSKGHSIEKGASLIPIDDPTLLWMNAGVAALKKYFDGSQTPKNPRIVNVQKCIRTNDIERVGKTARHHTFFEMLGNFSIGDYFREEAVKWGYELLVSDKWFGFDPNRLYMTVYPDDLDTRKLWEAQGIDPTHIVATEDSNFWEIGDGPCGPCTEIFYDRGPEYGDFGVDAIRDDIDNERFVEIWNIVFSQYNAISGLPRSAYPELPKKNIDTGSGLERIAMVLQEVTSNYETDLFMPIIERIEAISGIDYTGQMSFKVIADHIRTVTFAIADGALMSNEGRGYVLRRLLRRAVKHGKKLGIERTFMAELVDVVGEIMNDFYPYVKANAELIKQIVSQEEAKFLETLATGEKKFTQIVQATTQKTISGADAFMLYDTFGFPIELTIEYAEEIGYDVDQDGFQGEMQAQRDRARHARKDIQSMKTQNEAFLDFTEPSEFVGYDVSIVETKIIKVFDDGVVLEKTPFYATSGGQVSDTGVIYNDDFQIQITHVEKLPNHQFIHHFETSKGMPIEGAKVTAAVNQERRKMITYHHSATHLLFKALRDHLGPHVSQQGSQVSDLFLRFDFNHFRLPSDEDILHVEHQVNQMIASPYQAKTMILPVEEAVKKGAIAEFGEKYDDLVRTVDLKYTLDLCGGTHVKDIHDIRRFAIRAVYSIGSGIYRIEALANQRVEAIIEAFKGTDENIAGILHKAETIVQNAREKGIDLQGVALPEFALTYSYQDMIHKRQQFENIQQQVKELEKQYNQLLAASTTRVLDTYLEHVHDHKLIISVGELPIQQLKQLADNLFQAMEGGFVFLSSSDQGKVLFVAKSSIAEYHAGEIVKFAAQLVGGNGGGRHDFAQAGGKDVDQILTAIDQVKERLS
ncbi:MAG: alanine--tRNA ligase [Candidatus Izemoplasmatales bacterium]|nr:alanine--tRNA ligase [Candidatus Izemoplasmatales bacterium]